MFLCGWGDFLCFWLWCYVIGLLCNILWWCVIVFFVFLLLIVSVVMHFVDWPILDPLLSVGFTLFILINVLRSLKTTFQLFLQATPDKELLDKIEESIVAVEGVADTHHLHLWSLDGENHVLSVHINTQPDFPVSRYAELKQSLKAALSEFELSHTTLEIELSDEQCRNA